MAEKEWDLHEMIIFLSWWWDDVMRLMLDWTVDLEVGEEIPDREECHQREEWARATEDRRGSLAR